MPRRHPSASLALRTAVLIVALFPPLFRLDDTDTGHIRNVFLPLVLASPSLRATQSNGILLLTLLFLFLETLALTVVLWVSIWLVRRLKAR